MSIGNEFNARLIRVVDVTHAKCAYCGSRNVRMLHEPYGSESQDYICRQCFSDDQMCWNDLPYPWEKDE